MKATFAFEQVSMVGRCMETSRHPLPGDGAHRAFPDWSGRISV